MSKLFSGASTKYGAAPNGNVSVFDAAIPGTLPVIYWYIIIIVVYETCVHMNLHLRGLKIK